MFLPQKLLKGGLREGWFIYRAPFLLESFSCKGRCRKKQRDTSGKTRGGDSRGGQHCPSRRGSGWLRRVAQYAAGCGSTLKVLTGEAFPDPTPAAVPSARIFYSFLPASCFTPPPPFLDWLPHCPVSSILDFKHAAAGNASLFSNEAML